MKLVIQMIKLLCIYCLVIVAMMLVVMFPRETNQVEINKFSVNYHFSMREYFQNLKTILLKERPLLILEWSMRQKHQQWKKL
ncbi:hypothetical protein [Litchfieldia alkalitelluris]|uniref:hypothetical protein n=1 Tax=Litchfieldia alkalitelluris TaxID=304268 RepID=UPI0009974E11|nr:hypothetical protein [Litchfieldia alkalitelluris]